MDRLEMRHLWADEAKWWENDEDIFSQLKHQRLYFRNSDSGFRFSGVPVYSLRMASIWPFEAIQHTAPNQLKNYQNNKLNTKIYNPKSKSNSATKSYSNPNADPSSNPNSISYLDPNPKP